MRLRIRAGTSVVRDGSGGPIELGRRADEGVRPYTCFADAGYSYALLRGLGECGYGMPQAVLALGRHAYGARSCGQREYDGRLA